MDNDQSNNNLHKGVSVIICCYNSAWIIERTLNALKNQIVRDGLSWEIILVDNNCMDNTVAVAQATMLDSPIPFSIVAEKKQGLVFARKCGVNKAQYDVLIYCDDDNLLCDSYVETMYDIMSYDTNIGAVGGKGIAEFQKAPDPVVNENLEYYAVGSQMEHKDWLFGSGLTLRTKIVNDVYENQQCYLIGRKGCELLSGDDSELVMSMVLRGYRVVPTDSVYYVHVLKANRLSKEYFERMRVGIIMPSPVYDVFRDVIHDVPFAQTIRRYCGLIKSIMWSLLYYKNPKAKSVRKNHIENLRRYNYWGLFRLWNIHKSWRNIKRKSIRQKESKELT